LFSAQKFDNIGGQEFFISKDKTQEITAKKGCACKNVGAIDQVTETDGQLKQRVISNLIVASALPEFRPKNGFRAGLHGLQVQNPDLRESPHGPAFSADGNFGGCVDTAHGNRFVPAD
jgi:hypothetical protein